ncbi:MAG: HEAT repeat domain-containing protein, partial [Planctomycetales bacterium]
VDWRMWLCKALGEFEVNEGMPALLQAVKKPSEPEENRVRLAALESIALLAGQSKSSKSQHADLIPVLLQASQTQPDTPTDEDDQRTEQYLLDDAAQVRLRAAFAMGLVADDSQGSLKNRLSQMADPESESHPQTRCNAVIALARQGDSGAIPHLGAMLDPDSITVDSAEDEESQKWYRALILKNAITAVVKLRDRDADADLDALISRIEKLQSHPVEVVKNEAAAAIKKLKPRRVSTTD